MTKRRADVTVIKDLCKSCSLCVNHCPVDILEIDEETINAAGHNPVKVIDPEKCIGCETCMLMCPDTAIVVEKL